MMKNIPRSSRPRIWCPKEDYRDEDGISMSATSGSSSCQYGKQMQAVVHWGTKGMQQGDLYVLEPSKLVIDDPKLARYSIRWDNSGLGVSMSKLREIGAAPIH
ncbi:hypothetical protein WN48_05907 [Eufriesea mexicana]|uniref:Uncharacterized protein n=1 Tax=Eufriesea mexicana TaxID=516756 RepID=A0A310SLV9_9HYME|nr:hypothetical protein WN48_05907 [Eufriesea mexicana]